MEQQEGEGEGGPHIREREPPSNLELGGHDPARAKLTIRHQQVVESQIPSGDRTTSLTRVYNPL